jgi:hypothetical protein
MLATIVSMFLAMSVFSGGFFATSMHLQGALHFSALRAGLTFIPTAVLFALISLNWGRVPARYQRWLSLGGFVLAALSSVGQALVYNDGGTHGLWLYVVLALNGLGMGAAFSPLMTLALMRVPVADAADTSGVLGTVMQLAITVGVLAGGVAILLTWHLEVVDRFILSTQAHRIAHDVRFDTQGRPTAMKHPDGIEWIYGSLPQDVKYCVANGDGRVLLSSAPLAQALAPPGLAFDPGRDHFTLRADDGRDIREDDVFQPETQIADPGAGSAGRFVGDGKRDRDLDLVARADPPLVRQGRRRVMRCPRADSGGHHPFTFGKGLLGEQRARQVQFAGSPRRVLAQSPDVLHQRRNLFGRQQVAERRHDRREPPGPAAVVDDRGQRAE